MCPGVSNAMHGDPWCHPAPAAEVLHAFLCLSGFKEQYLSSGRKLENLAIAIICLLSYPLISLGLASFFLDVTLSRSICMVFNDYSNPVIVAEMTNF